MMQVFALQPAWADGGRARRRQRRGRRSCFFGASKPRNGRSTHRLQVLARPQGRRARAARPVRARGARERPWRTWLLRAAAAEPDVVRVESPRRRRAAARGRAAEITSPPRRELERVLEVGGALPPNPDVLLPVTRTITYRAPRCGGRSDLFQVDLEDFATGWVDRRNGPRRPGRACARAWHLAWSRESMKPHRSFRVLRDDAPRRADVSVVLLRRFRRAVRSSRRPRRSPAILETALTRLAPQAALARRRRRRRRALPVDRGARSCDAI